MLPGTIETISGPAGAALGNCERYGFAFSITVGSAPRHRRHLRDVPDLAGEVGGHHVDVVGQIFPGAGDAADLGLAAEPAFGAHLASDVGALCLHDRNLRTYFVLGHQCRPIRDHFFHLGTAAAEARDGRRAIQCQGRQFLGEAFHRRPIAGCHGQGFTGQPAMRHASTGSAAGAVQWGGRRPRRRE
jgi:hypothetical protein